MSPSCHAQNLDLLFDPCKYLREYIPLYSTIAAPLYVLSTTKGHFRYSDEALAAFSRLREALVVAVEITTTNPVLPMLSVLPIPTLTPATSRQAQS